MVDFVTAFFRNILNKNRQVYDKIVQTYKPLYKT